MNAAEHRESSGADEIPIDPALPIVDPHHHLWDYSNVPGLAIGAKPFLLPEFQRTVLASGHQVTQTVYVECGSMYRQEGPEDFRPIGETEFANGMAAMAASGQYGRSRVAGIVATANLLLGDAVLPILEAQIAAGNGRLRGLRFPTAYTDAGLFGRAPNPERKGLMLDARFRDGVRAMQRFGLSLDVWCVHTQLAELVGLATACADIPIVLDHLGTPLSLDASQGRDAAVFPLWRAAVIELARRPNVRVKLGGLGMDVTAPIGSAIGTAASTTLAQQWQPYVETCIEAFGVNRCMFESNFPVDHSTCSYGALWNAFKRITAACSADERTALFSGTAATCYKLT
jgi:L-fuconolactonase